jgi:hypothetical protein
VPDHDAVVVPDRALDAADADAVTDRDGRGEGERDLLHGARRYQSGPLTAALSGGYIAGP